MVVEYWISWRERKDRRKGAVEIIGKGERG